MNFKKCPNCGFNLLQNSNNWTFKENVILLYEYFNGESINNISQIFNKSPSQIRYQIRKLSIGNFCTQCLHEITNTNVLCSNCGHKLPKASKSKNYKNMDESIEVYNNIYPSNFYDSPIEIYYRLKMIYPDYILFIQNGYFFEIYKEDAKICSEVFGWIVTDVRNDIFTGVPINAYKFKDKLKKMGKKYIIVRQDNSDYKRNKIRRSVYEKYP